jgi:carboxymethylenebutenolidase
MQTRDIDRVDLTGGGFLALPATKGRHPGVIVIHEAFGLNDGIKEITKRFAGAGYAALAVDLFGGRNRAICMARFMAGMLRGSVDRYGIDDLKQALAYLMTLPEVDPERVGAIGFCMGGSFAIAWACTDERLKAIAPVSASNPKPIEAVQRLCAVVGSYPDRDFTTNSGRTLEVELTKGGIPHDIKFYPRAPHSMLNEDARGFNREAADDSWARVMSFFGTHLGAKLRPKSRPKASGPKATRPKALPGGRTPSRRPATGPPSA